MLIQATDTSVFPVQQAVCNAVLGLVLYSSARDVAPSTALHTISRQQHAQQIAETAILEGLTLPPPIPPVKPAPHHVEIATVQSYVSLVPLTA